MIFFLRSGALQCAAVSDLGAAGFCDVAALMLVVWARNWESVLTSMNFSWFYMSGLNSWFGSDFGSFLLQILVYVDLFLLNAMCFDIRN